MSREEELSTVVIDGEVLGNTQYVAYIIAENTGADIFRIEPVTPPLAPDVTKRTTVVPAKSYWSRKLYMIIGIS